MCRCLSFNYLQTSLPIKNNPFKMPSILTPDPSSSLAQSLVLHGRTLDVTRAVTREEAGRLREEAEKARQKQDKRNLYLMREGGQLFIIKYRCIMRVTALQLYFLILPPQRHYHQPRSKSVLCLTTAADSFFAQIPPYISRKRV